MNIYQLFDKAANEFPNNKAIISHNKSISYKELQQAVNNKGIELINKGILKGDKILVFIPMSIELYVFLLATFKIGAIAVFVDEWANKKRLTDCLAKIPCKGFAGNTKAKLLRFVYPPLRRIPIVLNSSYNSNKLAYIGPKEILPNDTALVTFTTGSTSIPKAANRTHKFLMAQYYTVIKELKTKSNHINLIGLPIVVLCDLGTGATSVLPNYNLKKLDKLNEKKVTRYITKHKISRIINSPSFFIKMGISKNKLPNIQHVFTGGAPVFPADILVFKNCFTNATFDILYGSTEAEPISIINANKLLLEKENIITDGLCVGSLSEDVKIKIINGYEQDFIEAHQLSKLEVTVGNIGEIIVSGDHVLKQYLNSETDTKKNKIIDGEIVWHRTGDAGKIINGKLYLQGRVNQLFSVNNELISPFIFEYLLSLNKHIIKGTILKLEDITAFIQPNEKVNKEELEINILNEFSIIQKVIFIKKMPLDPRHNSKIDYDKLKK